MTPRSLAALLLTGASLLRAQPPAIHSVQNAASGDASQIAPQMLVSIFGTNLAAAVATPPVTPLPVQLGGSRVTFNGIAAPLLYVSPGQINAQVPGAVPTLAQATVVVTTTAGASEPFSIPVGRNAPGIFTQDGSGCGQAAALNVRPDGTVSVNTPQNSLDPVGDGGIVFFATGLGVVNGRTDGVPAPPNLAGVAATANLGVSGINTFEKTPLGALYAGPAPGLIGVDQLNARVPGALVFPRQPSPEGCRVPVYLYTEGNASQFAMISIHSGGGACVDPPADSFGTVTWQKTIVSDTNLSSASDGVQVRFNRGVGIKLPEPPDVGAFGDGPGGLQPSVCTAGYPDTLSAGALALSGPGTNLTLTPVNVQGVVNYQAVLPAGSLSSGAYTVSASGASPGGNGVGAFTASAQIVPPIAITTNFSPGTNLPFNSFPVTWTGGDSRSDLVFQYIIRQGGVPVYSSAGNWGAESGSVPLILCGPCGTLPVGDVEFIVTQQPASPVLFNAPGLTLGGEQMWKYVFDFKGLTHH